MKRFWRGFFSLLLVLLVAGCSNKPSDDSIRQQVTDRLHEQYSSSIFDVINFKKVNGIPRDDNTYIAEVEYDLRFKVNVDDAAKALEPESENIIDAGMKAVALSLTYGNFKAGDIKHKKERVRFVRTEKGWLIDKSKK